MRRGIVAFLGLALTGLALTACGLNRFAERDPWRRQAEETCLAQKKVQPTAYMSLVSEINGPGVCGIAHPFKVAAFGGGAVGLARQVTLGCPMIPRVDGWLDEIVQPAASIYFNSAVVEIRAGTYSCRSRNNQRGAKLSEHSFGNAMDVMSFRLEDGREVSVVKGWRGPPEEQEFLREVFVGACPYFTTVLGPGSDVFHYNHFHLDLARHDPRGERHVCKPVLKFTPRIDPSVPVARRAPVQRPAIRPAPQPEDPGEAEDEEDPFVISDAKSRPGTVQSAALPPAHPSSPPAAPAPAPMAYRDIDAVLAATREPRSSRGDRLDARAPAPPPSRVATGPARPDPVVLQPQLWTAKPIY